MQSVTKKTKQELPLPKAANKFKKSKKERHCGNQVVNFNKQLDKLIQTEKEFEDGQKKCSRIMTMVQSRLMCASCDPTIESSVFGYVKQVQIDRDMTKKLIAACRKPFFVKYQRLRTILKAAFELIQEVKGENIKKIKPLFQYFDNLNDLDCYSIKEKTKMSKKDPNVKTPMQKFVEHQKALYYKSNRRLQQVQVEKKHRPKWKKKQDYNVKIDPKKPINHNCKFKLEDISHDLFKVSTEKRLEAPLFAVLDIVFNTLGDTDIIQSWNNLVPESMKPLVPVKTKGVKKLTKRQLTLHAKKYPNEIKKQPQQHVRKYWHGVNITHWMNRNRVVKKKPFVRKVEHKSDLIYKRPIKEVKMVNNPITKNKLNQWGVINNTKEDDKEDKDKIIFMKEFKNTGLKNIRFSRGLDQVDDKLTKYRDGANLLGLMFVMSFAVIQVFL